MAQEAVQQQAEQQQQAAPAPAAAPPQPPPTQPRPLPPLPQQKQQQQQQPVSTVDAVIDEVLGGDLRMEDRERLADEAAFMFFSAAREQAGGDLDPELERQLNAMVAIPKAEKDAILQRTNRVARRVLRPLGYKMLQLQGVDPHAADAGAARAALLAPLTPQQQAEVDAEARRLFDAVYLPEVQGTLQDLGVDARDPAQAWDAFGRDVLSRQERPQKQRPAAAIALPSAAVGALVALGVSSLAGWFRRRRQQRRGGSAAGGSSAAEDEGLPEEEEEGGEYGEEQLASDSLQDDASAYEAEPHDE